MRISTLLLLALSATAVRSQSVWSDDFSVPSTWAIQNDGAVALDWQIGPGLLNTGSEPIEPVASTSAANGYAMIDSDGLGNLSGSEENAFMTSLGFELVGTTDVLLHFDTHYRAHPSSTCYVVVGTDGTFPTLTSTTDISGMPNVFRLFDDIAVGDSTANPKHVVLDISPVAAGQPFVQIRFQWIGTNAYSWFIDDVHIDPVSDLAIGNARISNNTLNYSFGNVPQDQTGDTFHIGGTVYNTGFWPVTNAALTVDVDGPAPFSTVVPLGDIDVLDSATAVLPYFVFSLPAGIYTATFTVTCDQYVNELNLADNTTIRYFSVDNGYFAPDGIGVIPAPEQLYSSIGTTTYPAAADSLVLMSYVEVKTQESIWGMEALLDPMTQPGGYVVFAILDAADVLAGIVDNPIMMTDVCDVTAQDVANGRVQSGIDIPTLPPGGYYLEVILYSNAGADPIAVSDDVTYPQSDSASMVFDPINETLILDGNSFAIRAYVAGDPIFCWADFTISQAVDGLGAPIPFVLDVVNTSTTNGAIASYLWDFGDGATSTAQYPTHQYLTNGPFWICFTFTDGGGCSDQFCDSIMVDATGMFSRTEGFTVNVVPGGTTAVQERVQQEPFALWPNPVRDLLYFKNVSALPKDMIVVDAVGREVLRERSTLNHVNVVDLDPGQYFLRVNGCVQAFVKTE